MSFFSDMRAERLIAEIRGIGDPLNPEAQKAFQKLAKIGPGAIPKILGTSWNKAIFEADARSSKIVLPWSSAPVACRTRALVQQALRTQARASRDPRVRLRYLSAHPEEADSLDD